MEMIRVCILLLSLGVAATCLAAEPNFLGDRHVHSFDVGCDGCHEEDPPAQAVTTEKCQECHGNYQELAAQTENAEPNPHASHLAEPNCSECHRAHKPPTLVCDSCHQFAMKVP